MQRSLYHSCNIWHLFPLVRLARGAVLLPMAALGCSSDQVALGGRELELEAASVTACDGVETYDQSDIDALAGCTEILGKLWLHDFPGMDLTPLAALRSVRDTLYVGMTDGEHPVESLRGLEALEHVGGLEISRLQVSDLSSLHNLRSVRVLDPDQGFGYTGMISLQSCEGLTSLRGLERLEDWSFLFIQDAQQLQSLDGLVPPPTGGTIRVNSAPQLRDVSALGAARRMTGIELDATGVENFDGVALENLGSLRLENNPNLVQLDGLDGISSINELVVAENDALQRLPELPGLEVLGALHVTGNALLQAIPAYPASLLGSYVVGGLSDSPSPNKPEGPAVGFEFFVVGNNPALLRIAAPPGFSSGDFVAVYDNPSLIELDLGGMVDVDSIAIRNNAALVDVDVHSLEIVKRPEVVGNPLLPLAGFDGVAAAVREMSESTP